jgi:DNA-binding response OmpR family regulator
MKATILVVDDERDIQNLIRFHLRLAGFETLGALSGREALEAVQKSRPDLILLDLMLPDIDGFGVCEILRHNASTADIPIIIVSAWESQDTKSLGLDLGALDYMTKPFDIKKLISRVQSLVEPAVKVSA